MTSVPELGWELLTEAEKTAIRRPATLLFHRGRSRSTGPIVATSIAFFCSQADMPSQSTA
jgi:hypothetical protein